MRKTSSQNYFGLNGFLVDYPNLNKNMEYGVVFFLGHFEGCMIILFGGMFSSTTEFQNQLFTNFGS